MTVSGLLRCARYAVPPNRLNYCGPDRAGDFAGYVQEGVVDQGLAEMVSQFKTLYPYLTLIAFENRIRNPLDFRVVEAYWLGNSLLTRVSMRSFYEHLAESLGLKRKLAVKDLEIIVGKIPAGAIPHHSFHVFNVFRRTGHLDEVHTLTTMDACRIGWGKVTQVKRVLQVLAKPLVIKEGKLALGKPVTKTIQTSFFKSKLQPGIRVGDWISFHWDEACEVLSQSQVANLEYYTKLSLRLANLSR